MVTIRCIVTSRAIYLHIPLVHIYAWWEWERVILAALS